MRREQIKRARAENMAIDLLADLAAWIDARHGTSPDFEIKKRLELRRTLTSLIVSLDTRIALEDRSEDGMPTL